MFIESWKKIKNLIAPLTHEIDQGIWRIYYLEKGKKYGEPWLRMLDPGTLGYNEMFRKEPLTTFQLSKTYFSIPKLKSHIFITYDQIIK